MVKYLNENIVDTYNNLRSHLHKSYVILYKTTSDKSKIAYCSKNYDDQASAIRLVVNKNASEEFVTYLTVHEYGHIFFNHMEYLKSIHNVMKNTLETYKEKWAQKNLKKCTNVSASDSYIALLANIAQDLEINSKYYTDDQLEKLNQCTIEYMIEHGLCKEEEIKKEGFVFQHPDDYKDNDGNPFPRGLSFWNYFILLLEQNEQNNQSMVGASEITDENLKNALKNASTTLDQNCNSDLEMDDDKNGQPKQSNPTDDEDGGDGSNDNGGDGDGQSSSGRSGSGSGNRKKVENTDRSDLDTILSKVFVKRTTKFNRVDNMYYYNRRKYGNSDVLVSKIRNMETVNPVASNIIIDCSGSMDTSVINKIILALKEGVRKGVISKRSKIVWWNTRLVGEQNITKMDFPEASGGTELASAITKYGPKSEMLVIISDYDDNLKDWAKALKKSNSKKVGILYGKADINKDAENALRKAGLVTYKVKRFEDD